VSLTAEFAKATAYEVDLAITHLAGLVSSALHFRVKTKKKGSYQEPVLG
jgi:hypothetical protein